ncbi:protein of unknown function [Taphrina deformans PYCC 5710]|uniref:Uncharacterized protein n=1 Tax=Taphrina deformans (strain PYCC 5710 / ATCC 11124 / CBS 356.35 / IMI 108563 / JCM 9778 / NBRC 8474) TaxID=1097556 RepID=R4XEL8_TAPDE|nr:protein of unknown function [Taphrina deformans PYCC 5710]|eukprot:CCG84216.1 protein of unknown function [Taphrina deformans PYCC 5710]
MVHPAQRICCADGYLFYAISQTISRYNITSGEITKLWTAEPVSAIEKQKNLEHRAVVEIVVRGKYLVWISEDKVLRVYNLETSTLLSERELVKRGCALFVEEEIIIVGDKFGDVYHYDLLLSDSNHGQDGKTQEQVAEKLPIVGHVSMLTSVLLTTSDSTGKRHVVSADRDEHIRVSNYPDGYNIQSYCLGHTQFVSSLLIPSGTTTLVSAGGDEYLGFWDYPTGKQTRTLTMNEAVSASREQGVGLAVLKLLEVPSIKGVAVLVEEVKKLFIYPLSEDSSEAIIIIDLLAPALDMALHESSLFVAYDTSKQDGVPNFACFAIQDTSYTQQEIPALNEECGASVHQVTYTSHKADLMRKRTKAELEAIRLASAQPRNKGEKRNSHGAAAGGGGGEEEEEEQDDELMAAIEADKVKTANNKKAKLST